MKFPAALLAAACALFLSACDDGTRTASPSAAAPPPAPAPVPPPAVDEKVESAQVPEAPWGQVPAAPSPTTGDSGESAGNAADTAGAEVPPSAPDPDTPPEPGADR